MTGLAAAIDAPNDKVEEQRSKPVELWTLAVGVVCMLFTGAKFLGYDKALIELERRQNEVAAKKAEAEVLAVEGEILPPDAHVLVDEEYLALWPVYVHIRNDGDSFVDLKSVEFRVFIAPLEHVGLWKDESGEQPVGKPPIGMLDPDSPKWQEVAELTQSLQINDGVIAPGTSRTERRHVISISEAVDLLKKVEVRVVTKTRNYRWYGFIGEGVCSTEPFSSSSASAYRSEAVAAPAVEEAPAPPPPLAAP